MSAYIRQQALIFIQHIDHSHAAFKDFNWSLDESALISAAADICRTALVTVEVKPVVAQMSPRIVRLDEDVDALRERCMKGTWRSVGQEFSFPDGLDYCSSPDPSLNSHGGEFGEWTWQINRHSEWLFLAQHYHSTQDDRCAEAVSGWLRNWLEQCPCPSEDIDARQGSWRTIEIGIRMGSMWPQVLSAFHQHPAFDDELFLAWLQAYAEQATFVYPHRKQNNWLLMEMNGLMHAGVQLPMHQDSALWRTQASDALLAEIGIQFHDDGIQRELSASYHAVCFFNYMQAIDVLQKGGYDVDLRLQACLRRMLNPCRALARPNGILFDFQDSNALNIQKMLERVPADWYEDGDEWFLGKSTQVPQQLHHVLENAGYAILRSGYADEDVCIAFDAGPYGDSHQHEDKLSIQVHAYGRDLIGEAGIVDYSGSPERTYSLTTLAHSTAIVDGLMQHRKMQYLKNPPDIKARAVLDYDLNVDEAWVEAVYDEGYGPDELPLLQHRRKIILKSQTEIQVIDTFSQLSNESHNVEILFHCAKDHAVLDSGIFQSTGDGANVSVEWTCEQSKIESSMCCAGTEPDLRGWGAPDDHSNGLFALVPRPCLTLSLCCTQKTVVTSTIRIIRPA